MGIIDKFMTADYLDEPFDWEASIEHTRRQGVIDDRKRRERDLVGKYLVMVTARYQNNLDLFLQDNQYGDGHWTKFLSNAKGFYDESAAIVKAKNLQFNSPRVVFVQANGKLKEVYRNGKRTR